MRNADAICPELAGLTGPFTKIARAMSSHWGVRIIPSGVDCSTDGDVIHIPYTADYLPLHMRQALHGCLDHEVCHVAEERRHKAAGKVGVIAMMNDPNLVGNTFPKLRKAPTDEKKHKEWEAKIAGCGKTLRSLLNVYEDIRIETAYSVEFPGMAENLDVNNRRCAGDWQEKFDKGEDSNFWHKFGAAVILVARGQECQWAHDDPEIAEALEICADEIDESTKRLDWADDALDLAKRTYKKLKKHAEEQEEKRAKGGKGGSSGGGGGPGGDGVPEPHGALGEAEVDDLHDLSRAKMMEYVIEDASIHDRYIPHPTSASGDRIVGCGMGDPKYYNQAKAEVAKQIGGLRARQRVVLQSWSRRRLRTGLEEGFIDDDTLPAACMGDHRVFSDITKKRDLNTAIEVLIDCSGSTGGNLPESRGWAGGHTASYYSLRTAIALTEAWSTLGVPNEFTGFYSDDDRTLMTVEDMKGPYVCRPPFNYMVFKSFDEKLSRTRGRFCSISGAGSNADGEAVMWAARRLASRKEARKILVVISDGMPATSGVHDFGILQRHLRTVVKMITGSGIEVIGIGAGTDDPKEFYNQATGAIFVEVNDLTTMATDIFKIMKSKLTGIAA